MKKIVYGWKSSLGKQLFVYQKGINWGVTYQPSNAAKFKTIPDCINHWRGKHAFPEEYEHLLSENFLQFFDGKTNQQILYIH